MMSDAARVPARQGGLAQGADSSPATSYNQKVSHETFARFRMTR
jgi:hypothetical protein